MRPPPAGLAAKIDTAQKALKAAKATPILNKE